jgi:PAS domain S-box-containing protein
VALRHRQAASASAAVELRTSAPAFVSDEQLRIVSWNDAARRLVGFEASEAIGRSCAEIMGCPSRGGHVLCLHAGCADGPRQGAESALTVCERFIRRKDGKIVSASVSIVEVRSPESAPLLLHLLRDLTRETQLENALRDVAALAAKAGARPGGAEGEVVPRAAAAAELLTQRETEVVRLLSAGADTAEIASTLGVSPATVRNHIQSLFRKLHAHSRLEAVSLAVKNRLL